MTHSEEDRTCGKKEVDADALQAGEENPRGVEKPGGFFSLGGAPVPGLAAEKPGGFFSGPSSGEDGGVGFQPAPNNDLAVTGQAGSLPHEPEELLQKLAAPVPWKRGGRPTVLTPEVREQVCKLLSVGLSRRQAGAYLNIDPTTITHAAARDEEFARELERAQDLAQVPAMMSLLAASRKDWRAALSLLNRKQSAAPLSAEEKRQKHQERLEAVRKKSEITRLQSLMFYEEFWEKQARSEASEARKHADLANQKRVEQETRRAEEEKRFPRRKKRTAAD